MQSSLHRIVVVGGGAGGLELITSLGRKLGKKGLARPILIDGTPTHIWKPLLHAVATGLLNTGTDELNYFSHSTPSGYEFEYGWVDGLDLKRKVLKIAPLRSFTDDYDICGAQEIEYDTLVLAVGGVSESYGIPGVREHCISLDTQKDAELLRKKILNKALGVMQQSSITNKIRVGIVGGGATGVELAAEIHRTISELKVKDHLEITIMEGGPRILGAGVESMSKYATIELQKRKIEIKTNCGIKSVNERGFVLGDGSQIHKEIKVWAAGIKAPDWLAKIGLQVNRSNRIMVDENLQCLGQTGVYAMGDCSFVPMGKEHPDRFLPTTAQVAHQEAEWLTKKLAVTLKHKTCDPFVYKPQGMLVSLGSGSAVGNLAGIFGPKSECYVEGVGAKLLYASLYRMHQARLYGWTRAGCLWAGDKLRHVAIPPLKLH